MSCLPNAKKFCQFTGGKPDEKHSESEKRHFAYGKTDKNRLLTIVYTMRGTLIRVISPRPMNRKERKDYAEAIASNTLIQKRGRGIRILVLAR